MSRTAGRAARFFTVKDVTLRREAIVIAMALLLLAAAIPFAIVDTIEKGRVYLFSWQFIEELPQRFTRPGRFRFILQPMISIIVGIRGGLADAKAGILPTYSVCFSMQDVEANCCEAEQPRSACCLPWGSSWTSSFSWSSTGRFIQPQPCWLGRFSFASPTHSPL